MALELDLKLENFRGWGDDELKVFSVNDKKFGEIEFLLQMEMLKAIDPKISDGISWVDYFAISVLDTDNGEHGDKSSSVFRELLLAYLNPENAAHQNEYGRLTQRIESDLIQAAILRYAITTLFLASVASNTYDPASLRRAVESVVKQLVVPSQYSEGFLLSIADILLTGIAKEYTDGVQINPDALFRISPPQP